jgi:hypothetical protein
MEYNYWRFSIQYFGIALVILTSVAGGLAKELLPILIPMFAVAVLMHNVVP